MPDETTNSNNTPVAEAAKPAPSKASLVPKPEDLTAQTVTRNEVALSCEPVQIKKGKTAGTWYLAPDISDKDKFFSWIGAEKVFEIVKAKVFASAQGWTDEATNAEDAAVDPNKFFPDKFISFAEQFSARGESISDLEAQRDGLLDEMASLDPDNESDGVAIIALMKQIKAVNADMAAKKRKPKVAAPSSIPASPATAVVS